MILLKQGSLKTKTEQARERWDWKISETTGWLLSAPAAVLELPVFWNYPALLKGQLCFENTFPGALDVHSRFQIPILNSEHPGLLTQSGKTENKPWQTKSQRALLRGKCKQFYILFIDFPMFSLCQKHQEWYELYCGGKSDLFLSSRPTPSPNFLTGLQGRRGPSKI